MYIPMKAKNITFVRIFFIYSHYEPGKLFLTGATFFCPPTVNTYFPCKFSFSVNKINTIYHGRSENMKFISRSLRSLVRYLVHTRNKFHISSHPCNILYVCYSFLTKRE